MGFTLTRHKCGDINECIEFPGLCPANVHCENTMGSYICGCLHGYQTLETGCVDIDECANQEICPENSICLNSAGNYTCQCHPGFGGHLCEDEDECALIGSCDTNANCSNTFGSYSCSCNIGFHGDGKTCKTGHCDDRTCIFNAKCVSRTTNECECIEGYSNNTDFCEDKDECLLGHDCDQNAFCVNSEGSYSCICKTGYAGDGKRCREGFCEDNMCSLNEECVSPKKLECRCKTGFERSGFTKGCTDIDECSSAENVCDENADCINTEASYECSCSQGFYGTGRTCFLGSCSDSSCPLKENKKCVSPRTTDCYCVDGFQFNNSSECVDIDECQDCDANADCENTIGSFGGCHCKTGFTGDGMTCSDIDECATGVHNCAFKATCTNKIGSFSCSCNDGVGCIANWILVLNTRNYENVPLIIDGRGKSKKIGLKFQKKTEALYSCSVVWQRKMFLFGGIYYNRQISVVEDCKVKLVGQLDFDMNAGACAQRDNAEIFICFYHKNWLYQDSFNGAYKNCQRATGPLEQFSRLPNSTFDHNRARIAVTSG